MAVKCTTCNNCPAEQDKTLLAAGAACHTCSPVQGLSGQAATTPSRGRASPACAVAACPAGHASSGRPQPRRGWCPTACPSQAPPRCPGPPALRTDASGGGKEERCRRHIRGGAFAGGQPCSAQVRVSNSNARAAILAFALPLCPINRATPRPCRRALTIPAGLQKHGAVLGQKGVHCVHVPNELHQHKRQALHLHGRGAAEEGNPLDRRSSNGAVTSRTCACHEGIDSHFCR